MKIALTSAILVALSCSDSHAYVPHFQERVALIGSGRPSRVAALFAESPEGAKKDSAHEALESYKSGMNEWPTDNNGSSKPGKVRFCLNLPKKNAKFQ